MSTLREKRNLSAFRQYQEHISRIFDEDNEIFDCSDSENEENRINNTAISIDISFSANKPSLKNLFYTPPAKRIKRIPLSTVRHKPQQIERPRRVSFDGTTSQLHHDLNWTLRAAKHFDSKNIADQEEPELTIEWSSSDESENNLTNLNTSDATQSMPIASQCTQSSACSEVQKVNPFKRCRRNGYLHQFQEVLKQSNADRKFLQHDKKFGIRPYVSLRVLSVEHSFGVHLATVISPSDEILQIVLHADMAQNVTEGSILESFVELSEPYMIERSDGIRSVTVQPCKFLLS